MNLLWDIVGKNYGIYWVISMGYIQQKLWDKTDKIMGYIGKKLWDILGKHYGKY